MAEEVGLPTKASRNMLYHGYSYKKLSRQEFEMCFKKLSDLFRVKIHKADVYRIDLAHNFCVEHLVSQYFYFLVSCGYYARQQIGKSLFFRNNPGTILFYNKVTEGSKSDPILLKVWASKMF